MPEIQSQIQNICGLLVRAHARDLARVSSAIEALPGTEVHADDGNGQIVVTVEDSGQRQAAETLTEIDRLDGVISASLVYHYRDEDMPPGLTPDNLETNQ